MFKEGFGTLFTAVYKPSEGIVEMRWPGEKVTQTFENFQEQYKLINYNQPSVAPARVLKQERIQAEKAYARPIVSEEQSTSEFEWQENVVETLVHAMAQAKPSANKEQLEKLRGELSQRGQVSWEVLADFWSQPGKGYRATWNN